MQTNSDLLKTNEEKMVVIERLINAPRELVFQAWTDATQLAKWYAPTGCSIHFEAIDIREGGEVLSCIHTPDGKDCWCKGTYLEINGPERIVYTMANTDEKGIAINPADIGMDADWPQETTVTVTFKAQGDNTLLTLEQTVSETLARKTGAYPGWVSMFERMEELLANEIAA